MLQAINKMDIRLAIFTPGQLFGERDYVLHKEENPNKVFYSYSVRCVAATGELFVIKKEEFLNKLKFSPESIDIFYNS